MGEAGGRSASGGLRAPRARANSQLALPLCNEPPTSASRAALRARLERALSLPRGEVFRGLAGPSRAEPPFAAGVGRELAGAGRLRPRLLEPPLAPEWAAGGRASLQAASYSGAFLAAHLEAAPPSGAGVPGHLARGGAARARRGRWSCPFSTRGQPVCLPKCRPSPR